MSTNRRIKILHVLFTLDPGGMENGVVNVARALPADRFEIHVACLERSGAFAQRLQQPENVHVIGKAPGFSLRTVLALARVIRRVQPHVIHSHNLGPLIYGALASGFGKWKPLLQGEHSLLPPHERTARRLRQRHWLYRCCRAVHTVSTGVRDDLLQLGFPETKIVTLRNGVDCARFAPGEKSAARKKINLPENTLVLGLVSRFVKGKGHLETIAAFEQLAASRPEVHLLFIGGGGSEEDIVRAAAARSTAAARIHFSGFQNDVTPYYQSLDLLVVASTHEGLSNVVLEAMACGVPALAHPACGNPEVITHGVDGWLGELETPEKLHAQLAEVLSRPERLAALCTAAREKMARDFSIDSMVDKYRRLYEELSGVNR
jgi:glycosyltransferase involved in cell wall biosynthesis